MLVIIWRVGPVFDVSNYTTWGFCYVLLCLATLYLLISVELLISLLAFFVIPFSV